MNEGQRLIETEGSTEPAKHMYHYQQDHDEGDVEFKAIGFERSYMKRGVKEAIEIMRRKPNLNQDPGRKYIPPIFKEVLMKDQGPKQPASSPRGAMDRRPIQN